MDCPFVGNDAGTVLDADGVGQQKSRHLRCGCTADSGTLLRDTGVRRNICPQYPAVCTDCHDIACNKEGEEKFQLAIYSVFMRGTFPLEAMCMKAKRFYYGKADAYMTVEAALILPIVFLTVLLVIFLLIFQYNRCLMEQDIGILALRGTTLTAADREELAQRLVWQEAALYREKYLAWSSDKAEIHIEKNIVKVKQRGYCTFPFPHWSLWEGGSVWETTTAFENHIQEPAAFVRNCQELIGGK